MALPLKAFNSFDLGYHSSMPYSSASTIIHVPFEVVWNFLLDRLGHPDYYMEQVNSFQIYEKKQDHLVRHIETDSFSLTERVHINFNTKEIQHVLVDHPKYSGTVVYRALEQKSTDSSRNNDSLESEVALTMTIDWKDKTGESDDLDDLYGAMLRKTCESIKELLEKS